MIAAEEKSFWNLEILEEMLEIRLYYISFKMLALITFQQQKFLISIITVKS